jgi:hypothetical protein
MQPGFFMSKKGTRKVREQTRKIDGEKSLSLGEERLGAKNRKSTAMNKDETSGPTPSSISTQAKELK